MKLLTLDRHTAPFFAPEFHSGAVETTLDVRGRIFEARLARDIKGTTRIVIQAKDNPRLGTFMAEQDRYLTRQLQAAGTLENYARAQSHKSPVHVERMCFFEPALCMIGLSERSRSYRWGTPNGKLIEMTNHSTGEVDFDFDSHRLPARLSAFRRQDFFS